MATEAILANTAAAPVPEGEPAELEWSKWFRCETSFNLMLAPQKPGIYAVGEEIVAPDPAAASRGKRLLALHQFAEADDLARALGRLFTPASPLYERVGAGRCFLRYAVIDDAELRQAALRALQGWLQAAETAATQDSRPEVADPAPLPAGF